MKKEKRETKFYHAFITVVIMAIMMFTAVVKFKADPQIPLVFGCLVAGVVAIWIGYSWDEILGGMIKGITQSLEAILILMLIGVLVGVWIACGTVPTMIYYGLQIVSAKYFLLTTMVICTVVSFAIGSWGAVGTIGLAFMGIGLALKIPAPLVAGCIVSGSYMGEVISPLSDATNLTAAVVGENVFDIVRKMARPALAVFGIVAVLYLVIGFKYASSDAAQVASNINPLLENLNQYFRINPFALLPMAVMVLCILIKFPAIPSMLIGIVCGMVEAVVMQGVSLQKLMEISYSGYVSRSGQKLLDSLLSAGGMSTMMYSISIVIIAMSFGGIMQSTMQMQALIAPLVNRIRSRGGLNFLSVISCIAMNILLPDQYLGISVPGQMYLNEYEKRRIDKTDLAQMLLGGGAVTSPLIPWNTCGIYVMTILGVSAMQYAPYALYCFVLPFGVIAAGFWGSIKGRKKTVLREAEHL